MRGEVNTGRIEAFSDGVFAISITLLILQVGINTEGGSLAYRLAEQWPSYVSFVVSFAIIGILWLNHHQMFRDIRVADHGLFVLNLGLLLVVSFIPFPTEVIGDELASGNYDDQRTAAVFYGLTFVGATLAFNALWLWAARRRRLIEHDVPQPFVDRARAGTCWGSRPTLWPPSSRSGAPMEPSRSTGLSPFSTCSPLEG